MKAALSLSVLLLSVTLWAQEAQRLPGGGLLERFKQLDTNGDGKVSAEEYPRPLFRQMDTDGDGFVTLEEATWFFRERRKREDPPPRPDNTGTPAKTDPAAATTRPNAKAGLPAVVYELRVRDVAASAKFYRDGIGMQVVAEDAKEVLLSLFGTGLRLLPAMRVEVARLPYRAGHPVLELLAANGFRYPSLWFRDPAAVCQRIENAGYRKPQQGRRNLWFARDPDGNPVEIMGVPRTAKGEAFTIGFLARDGNATRKFLAEILGITEGAV